MEILGFMLGLVVIIAVVILMKKGKSNGGGGENTPSDENINLEEPSTSTIHFSDDFKSGEPIITTDHDHIITTILTYKKDSFIWVCPMCETENLSSAKKCCVCHYVK